MISVKAKGDRAFKPDTGFFVPRAEHAIGAVHHIDRMPSCGESLAVLDRTQFDAAQRFE